MVTASHSPRVESHLSAKRVLFWGLGILTLFVLYHNERFLLNPQSGTWRFFNPVRGKLLVHAVAGATALVLGALQFSTRLRRRCPALHRLLGRCYIVGVMIAGPMAVYLAFVHALPVLKAVTTVQASLWTVTTLLALVAARNFSFDVHQQWMMRSYSITLIFVFSRIILDTPILGPTTDLGAERLAWILNICALLVPQLIINRHQLFARPRH
jgi:uncharacterized membrane protein